ncbi:hypothetical protein B0F90DRAFT_1727149 [Multifurca ochricompacta]|uniref:Uncharacterized protein n=1 Tax=Multifurca ochricompacta TaxID=376703 RepID=A0AAD4M3F4_9AGAM|nr:hypothetical protein B0F90DRAFT_1727149 [Multifurca ochricompacta]
MLCNWSAKANVTILRNIAFGRNARKTLIVVLNSWPSGLSHIHRQPFHNSASLHHSFKPTPFTSSPVIVDHLTPAQISRASAAAVRISVARGAVWDGFHLWHSLCWSAHHYHKFDSASTPRPPFRNPISAFIPIDFGRSVSTSLLRSGETKAAAMLAEKMMAYGEELRPLSFNILLRQLHPSASSKSPRGIYDRLQEFTPRLIGRLGPRVLELQNVMPVDPLTRFAVRLLNNAREHRWQRTAGMYESVLRACLIQGEILVASLLLALLLKDYQLRHACTRASAEAERVGAPDTMAYIRSKIPDPPSRGFRLLPYRNSCFLYQSVVKFLELHCADVDNPLFPEASQALANLASALDARKIPFTNLATLIKVLYSYPQCQHNVWVALPSGERQSRNAYRYFHGVLLNLLSSLPDRRPLDPDTNQLPALNLESYNALLNYALRFRHSITLADRILSHMTVSRRPPLAPSMTTYNILLRGCTLMRRNDIAENILQTIRGQMQRSHLANMQLECHRRRFSGLIEDTRMYELKIPKSQGLLEPDNTLLTTYIAHLVATGRPQAPHKKFLAPEELAVRWHASVIRGVALGPHFFAVVLNALRKAGFGRLAERVWTLARAAEAKSLEGGSTRPWCLSVHAYTAMLQLYADKTRGWHTRGALRPYPGDSRRAVSDLRKGMQIYRALQIAANKARAAVEWKHSPALPKADARFYNAALSLVSRRPGMAPRSSRAGPRWRWNRMLGEARQRFSRTGRKPYGWTPELEEIAKSLRNARYALPVGFRLRLVGRDEPTVIKGKVDRGARPYSFGRRVRPRFSPHRIPTVKRKGLPLKGRWTRDS